MIDRILVALDCSETSPQVLKALEYLQINPEGKIILAHVMGFSDTDRELSIPQPSLEAIETQLRTYQSHLRVRSEIEIITGDAAEEIIRLAHIHKVSLIVLGTRGLVGLKRVVVGSVSSQVVSDAGCSVLVVKEA